MSESESSSAEGERADVSAGPKDAAGGKAVANRAPASRPEPPSSPSRDLIVLVEPPETGPPPPPPQAPARGLFLSRLPLAAAAALAAVVAVAGALILEDRQQGGALADRARQTESLAHAVKSLKVRLDAIDAAMSRGDLAGLRQSVGEIKSTAVSTQELNGALAQLSERVDRLDRAESAKVDQLSERVDHAASARTAELATRIDKLEKKVAAPASAPPQVAQAKQPPARPKPAASVSMDATGSIGRPRPLLRGYIVLDARDDVALVGGRYGPREVREGDFLPGAGRVERIELGRNGWIVTTSRGLIASANFPANVPPY